MKCNYWNQTLNMGELSHRFITDEGKNQWTRKEEMTKNETQGYKEIENIIYILYKI